MTASSRPHSAPSILIVEDEYLVAMDMEMQLVALGYDVLGTVDTGEDALSGVKALRPDLVLMDVNLRGAMDGITAAAELQQRGPMPVVFVTALSSEDVLRRLQTVSHYGYLTKPYRTEDLQMLINAATATH